MAEINTLANIETDIRTVADIDGEVVQVAGVSSDVPTVAGVSSAVDVVASDLAGAGFDYDFGSVTEATEGVVGAPDGYLISVFTIRDEIVAVDGIKANITSVDSNSTNINTVAGISSNVTTVAGISNEVQAVSDIAFDVTTVANNVSDVTNFADVYVGPASSDPTTRTDGSALQKGDLYFNTTTDDLFVYDGSIWKRYAYSTGDTFTGDVTFEQDVTIEGTVDCGTIA